MSQKAQPKLELCFLFNVSNRKGGKNENCN